MGWGVEEGFKEGSKEGSGTPWEVESAESAGTFSDADSASMTAGGCAYESSAADSAAGCAESGIAEL